MVIGKVNAKMGLGRDKVFLLGREIQSSIDFIDMDIKIHVVDPCIDLLPSMIG